MNAPESFIENVRQQLVLIRRNAERAVQLQGAGHYGDSNYFVKTTLQMARELESEVAAAAEREIHTCSCGHTHYLHGDET